MRAFKTLGFVMESKTSRASESSGIKETDTAAERNPGWISARQEYYIRGLWDLASRNKDIKSLRKMIYRIGGVSDIRFLGKREAQKVILALRAIAEKARYNLDAPSAGED
jgi:hypothetical protein